MSPGAARAAIPPKERTRNGRFELRGRAADAYARTVSSLVARARLNRLYPDGGAIEALLDVLGPAGSHGTYDDVEVGVHTGLPTERMVTRAQADAAVAADACHQAESISPSVATVVERPGAPDEDAFIRRYRYHRALLAAPPPPAFRLRRELRRADRDARAAWLTVTLDRFDVSTGLFARHTILLRHEDPRWSRSQVRLDDDDVEVSENFDNLVARATAGDAELAFILLSRVSSITVESVTRCRVGPLWWHGVETPKGIRDLLSERPDEFVLSLPLDRADVAASAHRDGDPFGRGYRDTLSDAARDEVDELRRQYGYHMRRERKFVCTPGVTGALRDYLKRSGRPCVIYEAPNGP